MNPEEIERRHRELQDLANKLSRVEYAVLPEQIRVQVLELCVSIGTAKRNAAEEYEAACAAAEPCDCGHCP